MHAVKDAEIWDGLDFDSVGDEPSDKLALLVELASKILFLVGLCSK